MKAQDMLNIPRSIWARVGGRAATKIVKDADKGINNLLDANIIEKYFEQYNKGEELKNRDGDVIQRSVVEGRSLKVNSGIMKDGGISHDALIKKACDG